MKQQLEQLLRAAVREAGADPSAALVERTRDLRHGDFMSNVALAAKPARRDPRELALAIVACLPPNSLISSAAVAGAGFINFSLSAAAYQAELARLHEQAHRYGQSALGKGQRVRIQLVSSDPTEPPQLQQARLVAYGASLANLLTATGFDIGGQHSDGDRERMEVIPIQPVRLFRGSERLSSGEQEARYATLEQLSREIGNDACRYCLVMRSHEQPLDFDLNLAKLRTDENPVFHIQYAHARIASIMKQLAARGLTFDGTQALANTTRLVGNLEQAVLHTLTRYPEVLEQAAGSRSPHVVAHYLRELANTFHTYYNAEQFIVPDATLRNARLALLLGVSQVIRNGLTLLGVSSPESM